MIDAGSLRYRIPIIEKDTSSDNEGLISPNYVEVSKAWVSIIPIGGEIAQRKYGIVDDGISLKMVSRPNNNIKEQNVIIWNDKMYEIVYVAVFIERYESLLRPAKS